jgi:hypothetical protein
VPVSGPIRPAAGHALPQPTVSTPMACSSLAQNQIEYLRLSAGARDRRIEYRSTLIGAAFSAAEPSRAALTAAGPGAGSRPQPLAAEADHGGSLPADGDPAVPPADVVQAQPARSPSASITSGSSDHHARQRSADNRNSAAPQLTSVQRLRKRRPPIGDPGHHDPGAR